MGALYSSVYEMKDKIEEEQTQARLKEESLKRQEVWQRKEEERNFQLKLAYLAVTTLFLLYLWLWFALLNRWGRT
jgi:polyferredoxin